MSNRVRLLSFLSALSRAAGSSISAASYGRVLLAAYRRRFLGARVSLLLDLDEDLAAVLEEDADFTDPELDPVELRLIPVGTVRERVPRCPQM